MNKLNYSDIKKAVDCGIIDLSQVETLLHMQRKEEVKKNHKYAVKQLPHRGQLVWHTRVKIDGKLSPVWGDVGGTEEEFWDKVTDKYYSKESNPTFYDVWQEWFKDISKNLAPSSVRRYKRNYTYYISNEAFANIGIKDITEEILEDFIKTSIADKNLSAKQYSDMRTTLRGVLKMARRRKYLSFPPEEFFDNLDLRRRLFAPKSKSKSSDKIFTDAEISLLLKAIDKNPTIRNLAIALDFYTGVRVGELASLKRADFDVVDGVLHVSRTEITTLRDDGKTTECIVADIPKTDKSDRFIVLDDKGIEILNKIVALNPDDEYLISEKGKRIRANALRRSLYRLCDAVKIKRRAPHTIRRVYASTLLDNGVDDDFVCEQMGHEDIATTRKYYQFCKSPLVQKREIMKKALNY